MPIDPSARRSRSLPDYGAASTADAHGTGKARGAQGTTSPGSAPSGSKTKKSDDAPTPGLPPGTAAAAVRPLERAANESWDAFVRRTLVASCKDIASRDPAALRVKLDKMKDDPFALFRGTAFLFYGLTTAADRRRQQVLCNGDVHPDNFGTMRGQDGRAVFGLNDPDESAPASFVLDVARGGAGFALLADQLGLGGKARRHLVDEFADAYTDTIRDLADGKDLPERLDAKSAADFLGKDSPVTALLRKVQDHDQSEVLGRLTDHGHFAVDPGSLEKVPAAERAAVSRAVSDYIGSLDPKTRPGGEFFAVKDVVKVLGKGVGSLGRDRWYVLVEGPSKSGKDDVVLQVKVAIDSVLAPYGGTNGATFRDPGKRVASGYRVQQAGGDPLFGYGKLGRQSVTLREISPVDGRVDTSALSQDELRAYARACGMALALAHARSAPGAAVALHKDLTAGKRSRSAFEDDIVERSEKAVDSFAHAHEVLLELMPELQAIADQAEKSAKPKT